MARDFTTVTIHANVHQLLAVVARMKRMRIGEFTEYAILETLTRMLTGEDLDRELLRLARRIEEVRQARWPEQQEAGVKA